jgi:NADH:ubiquinone oxidoreductase subunit 3 (subunit A)
MLQEYVFLFIYTIVILVLVMLIPFFSTSLVFQENYKEKVSPYECGFEPFEDHIQQFEIRYYLIAILFLIFDLELAYLMPWIVNLPYLGYHSFFSMYIFFFYLVIAFYYEWLKGGLEWD